MKKKKNLIVLVIKFFNILHKVARGNSFLRIDKGPEAGTRCVLQAMKKFTGGLGDDDDREMGDNLVWKKYFTKVSLGAIELKNVFDII